MYKLILSLLGLVLWGSATGQHLPGKWSWGLEAGTFHYLGDLGYQGRPDWTAYRNFSPEETPWALGGKLAYRLSPAFSWQIQGKYGYLLATDRLEAWDGSLLEDNPNRFRALNARTELSAVETSLRFHMANEKWLPLDAGWDPYLEAGIGWMRFTPYGDLLDANGAAYHYWPDGRLRDLPANAPDAIVAVEVERDRQYETRLSDFQTNANTYDRQSLIVPMGLGLRRRLNSQIWLSWSLKWQLTFTDYLDDASGPFRTDSEIPLEQFAINPGGLEPGPSALRGNADDQDSYFFTGIGLEFTWGKMGKKFQAPLIYSHHAAWDPVDDVISDPPDTQEEPPSTPVPPLVPPARPEVEVAEAVPAVEDNMPQIAAPADDRPGPDTTVVEDVERPVLAIQDSLLPEAVAEEAAASATELSVDTLLAASVEESVPLEGPDLLTIPQAPESGISASVDSIQTIRVEPATTPVPAAVERSAPPSIDSVRAIQDQLIRLQAELDMEVQRRKAAEAAAMQIRLDNQAAIKARDQAREQDRAVQEAVTRVEAEEAYRRDREIERILDATAVPAMPETAPVVDTVVSELPASTQPDDTVASPGATDTVGASLLSPVPGLPDSTSLQDSSLTSQLPIQLSGDTVPHSPVVVLPLPVKGELPDTLSNAGKTDTIVVKSAPVIVRDTVVKYLPAVPDTIEKMIQAPTLATAPTLIGLARTSVHFDLGKTSYHPADTVVLQQVYEVMNVRPELMLLLEGYTDKRGSAELNMRLSKARAEGVAAFFIDRGISSDQIDIQYVGESRTRYQDGALDRRVDISLIPAGDTE